VLVEQVAVFALAVPGVKRVVADHVQRRLRQLILDDVVEIRVVPTGLWARHALFVGKFSRSQLLHQLHDTFTEALPLIEPVCVSVACNVSVPVLLNVTMNVCTPASAATNV
jgi:hypothetical protein